MQAQHRFPNKNIEFLQFMIGDINSLFQNDSFDNYSSTRKPAETAHQNSLKVRHNTRIEINGGFMCILTFQSMLKWIHLTLTDTLSNTSGKYIVQVAIPCLAKLQGLSAAQ